MLLFTIIKGKGSQKYTRIMLKSICKTEHFEANCLEIGYLLLKILRFFEDIANMEVQYYKTQFISQKHAYTCTFNTEFNDLKKKIFV